MGYSDDMTLQGEYYEILQDAMIRHGLYDVITANDVIKILDVSLYAITYFATYDAYSIISNGYYNKREFYKISLGAVLMNQLVRNKPLQIKTQDNEIAYITLESLCSGIEWYISTSKYWNKDVQYLTFGQLMSIIQMGIWGKEKYVQF